MKQRLLNVLRYLLVTGIALAFLAGIGYSIYSRAMKKAVLYDRTYVAAAAQLKAGLDYRTIGCLDDSSRLTIRKDSVIFNYKGSRMSYKTLYNEKDLRFYAVRADGVVVSFTRWRLQDTELMVLEQPEARFILNPTYKCPELPKQELKEIGGH